MPRILIIDDEPLIRNVLRQMLERAGYEIIDAPDGEAAMKLIQHESADLVITDILMPEKDGLETIIDLKRRFPEIKIIAMSGGGYIGPEDYLHMAVKLGVVRTFNKPIEREDLLAAVREILDGHSGRDSDFVT